MPTFFRGRSMLRGRKGCLQAALLLPQASQHPVWGWCSRQKHGAGMVLSCLCTQNIQLPASSGETSKPTASSRQNRFIAVCDLHLPAFLNTLWGPTALAFLFGSCLFHPIPNITNGVACPPRLLMHGKLLGVIVRAVHLLEISLENSF